MVSRPGAWLGTTAVRLLPLTKVTLGDAAPPNVTDGTWFPETWKPQPKRLTVSPATPRDGATDPIVRVGPATRSWEISAARSVPSPVTMSYPAPAKYPAL